MRSNSRSTIKKAAVLQVSCTTAALAFTASLYSLSLCVASALILASCFLP
jgi:hypothetical protein